jgi:two-component sensor histidine kinase
MPQFRRAVETLNHAIKRSAFMRYGVAAFFVLATVGFRAALDSVFSSGVFYHLYYPAVILSAYLLGAGPGVFAIVFSAGLAYGLFGYAAGNTGYVPLLSFVGSSSVAVFVLAHVRTKLSSLTQDYQRIDQLTRSQAELFRAHAGRVSDHLQLISALLQLHAREEGQPQLSRVLMNAASRTMLISRMHRTFADAGGGDPARSMDFRAFASRLAEAALAARDRPPLSIVIEGPPVHLPLEQATALGLVLLECINARAETSPRGVMRMTLSERGDDAVFQLAEEGFDADPVRDVQLLGAIAEQMRGNLLLSTEKHAATLQLAFPKTLPGLPDWTPLEPVH